MLAFPFAPMIVIFVPIVSFLSFKLEVHNTLKHRCKPKRPWKAQKAGSVFSLLYLISIVIIGIPMAIFFLATHTFPKNCDLQDNNVGLCISDLNTKNICMTDVTSPYYYLYGGDGVRGTLSSYPAMICNQACGMYIFFHYSRLSTIMEPLKTFSTHLLTHFISHPFHHNPIGPFVDVSSSAITPFQASIESLFVLGDIWRVLFNYPYIPWLVILTFFVALQARGNTANVFKGRYTCPFFLPHRIESSHPRLRLNLNTNPPHLFNPFHCLCSIFPSKRKTIANPYS